MKRPSLRGLRRLRFGDSQRYWERRYAKGGNSGPGSYGEVAAFKARTLNAFVREHDIDSVLELGCGDGHQLGLADYPAYVGLDVSPRAIRTCMKAFVEDPAKSFIAYDPTAFRNNGALSADLVISLDVIFHLVEDHVYESYMAELFGAAHRFVAVFSTNDERRVSAVHLRHRRFTDWVEQNEMQWELLSILANPHKGRDSVADFYFYGRVG